MDDAMSIDKKEDFTREASGDSLESSPEPEAGPSQQENPGQPKRKGGRKPIYATSEERKQRNRQAQAAFRERRTEYIKQLEETIRVHETNLHSLQTAHRSAADECLMLRYKNSLLERILLEKGIDVQAELRAKTGSPSLGPTHMPQIIPQPPTIQRAIMNRHHQARRSHSNILPKVEPGAPMVAHSALSSPRPTPPSHHSSPTTASPGFPPVMTPPASDSQFQLQQQGRLQPLKPQMNHGLPFSQSGVIGGPLMKGPGNTGSGTVGAAPAPLFQNSTLQSHYEQLEQEYESQADMVDDQDASDTAGPGPYPATFQPLPTSTAPQQISQTADHGHQFGSMAQLLDPYDPMLDMDPFGLSASMHFPTQFTFDSNMR